jgi:hypothetical protein
MPATFDRQLRRLLVRAECTFVRAGKGSHEIWQSPISGRRFPVPVGIVSATPRMAFLSRRGCRRRSDSIEPMPRGACPRRSDRIPLVFRYKRSATAFQ